jgi:hypothetical protein
VGQNCDGGCVQLTQLSPTLTFPKRDKIMCKAQGTLLNCNKHFYVAYKTIFHYILPSSTLLMDADTEQNPRTCSKIWCHQKLPTNYRWKTCDHCCESDRKTKCTQRASEKAKKEAATSKQAGDKRKRVSDSSDTSDDEQPTL